MGSAEEILTISLKGTFFRANERSAIVLHNIMRYKLNKQSNGIVYCGFPENALAKVMVRLNTVHVSYRIYRSTPEDMLHVQMEKMFEDNHYSDYSSLPDGERAYQFICRLCDMSDEAMKSKESRPQGVRYVLDMEDKEIQDGFHLVKSYIEEMDWQ